MPQDIQQNFPPGFVTIPIELEAKKSVLQVAPGVINWSHFLIHYDGQYWMRNFCFPPSDNRCWQLLSDEQVLELK